MPKKLSKINYKLRSFNTLISDMVIFFKDSTDNEERKGLRRLIKAINPAVAAPLKTKYKRPIKPKHKRRSRGKSDWFKFHVEGARLADLPNLSGFSKRDKARYEEYQPCDIMPATAITAQMPHYNVAPVKQCSPEQQSVLQRYPEAKFRVVNGELQVLIDSGSQWCSMAWFRRNGYLK